MGGITITSLVKGGPITPEEAEAESIDRRAYRQNYENEPSDEAGALLPMELIQLAQRAPFFVQDEQEWSAATLARLHRTEGEFSIGQDVGRKVDLSVVTVLQRIGGTIRRQVGQLVMRGMSLAHQRRQMMALMDVIRHRTRRVSIDSTGLGTGLADELTEIYGSMIIGCNFSSTVPVTDAIAATGRKAVTMGLPERLALDLLSCFEDRTIEIMDSREMRDDLRKPGRVVSADGKRVSIAAERGTDGHADRFWALALAEHGFREEAWGAFDAATAAAVVTGGRTMTATPWISTWDPDAR
jgi:phage FluMu gp28-like protein